MVCSGKVLVPYRLMKPWLLIDWIYRLTRSGKNEQKHRNDLANACRKIITKKREKVKRGEGKYDGDTLMDFMMEKSEKTGCLTDEEIVNECCTFMLAGQDSVGTATAITLFLLANHPSWLEKCIEENDKIFGKLPNKCSPKIEDFQEMKYLDWCIKETLRLYPSVPLFARTLGGDVTVGINEIFYLFFSTPFTRSCAIFCGAGLLFSNVRFLWHWTGILGRKTRSAGRLRSHNHAVRYSPISTSLFGPSHL